MTGKMRLTPDEFAEQLPKWYCKYRNHNPQYFSLEERLTRKTAQIGYLNLSDLVEIAQWGGNQYNRAEKVKKANTDDLVKKKTSGAIQNLSQPIRALESMMGIKQWGRTYASKTLRFICPRSYGALDSKLIRVISQCRSSSRNELRRYQEFLKLCEQIRQKVSQPGPRENGIWFIADVEMALFQFIWDGGEII